LFEKYCGEKINLCIIIAFGKNARNISSAQRNKICTKETLTNLLPDTKYRMELNVKFLHDPIILYVV